jgi:hypothetical protein
VGVVFIWVLGFWIKCLLDYIVAICQIAYDTGHNQRHAGCRRGLDTHMQHAAAAPSPPPPPPDGRTCLHLVHERSCSVYSLSRACRAATRRASMGALSYAAPQLGQSQLPFCSDSSRHRSSSRQSLQ